MYPLKSVLVSFYWNGSVSNTWTSSVFEQSFKTLWLVQNASQCCFSNCSHQSYKTCLGHVVVKHLNPLILPFLLSFSQKSWEILKTSLFYFDTCQVSPISRYVLLLLMKTSQHEFPRAESRWFPLNSYFGRGHGCGVGEWKIIMNTAGSFFTDKKRHKCERLIYYFRALSGNMLQQLLSYKWEWHLLNVCKFLESKGNFKNRL